MACCININHTVLGGSTTAGGAWEYTSGPENPTTVTTGQNCSGTPQNVATGGNITLTGGYFSFDATGKAEGDYIFTYTLLAGEVCEVENTYTISVVGAPIAGEDGDDGPYCEGETTPIDIWACIGCDVLTCDTTGTWSGNGGTHANFTWTPGVPSAIFDPTGVGDDIYIFTYTVENTSATMTCDNCTQSVTCEVVIENAPNAGTAGSDTVCN